MSVEELAGLPLDRRHALARGAIRASARRLRARVADLDALRARLASPGQQPALEAP